MAKVERPDKHPPTGSFGEIVYLARMRNGITLDAAGRLAGFKNGSYIAMIENGERRPLLERVPRLALAVGLDPRALVSHWLERFAPSAFLTLELDRAKRDQEI